MASTSASAAVGWYDKSPSDMTLRELKQAICNAGLRGESEGFLEKSEFVGLLTSYLNDVRGQDECPVCLLPLNFAMKSILLPCKHRLCERCLTSIVSRDYLSCSCPLCRASVSETAVAIGMRGAGLTASVLFGGYDGDDKNEIMDRAEAQFREALHKDPHHAGFLTTLADIVLEKGNVIEAGMLCRRAIYFEPTNYVGFASLGHVYKAMDDLGAAIHCYEKSLALREHPDVITNLGNAYFAFGDIAAAVSHHRRAVELDPDNLMVVFNLGVTLEEGNIDIDEAISVYERALTLDAVGSNASPPGCMHDPISAALAEAREKKRSQMGACR